MASGFCMATLSSRAANATSGRIALDTGAYATGKLSAALIEPGKLTFVST